MFQVKLHVKIPVLLIIINFYHTNIPLAVLIGQMIYSYSFKEIGNKILLKTKYIRRCYCERIMQHERQLLSSSEIPKLIPL